MDDRRELVAAHPLSGAGEPASWRSSALSLTQRVDLGLLHLRGTLDDTLIHRVGQALGQSLPLACLAITDEPVRILRVRIDHWCLVVNEAHRVSTLRSLHEATLGSSTLVADVSGGAVWIDVAGRAAAELIAAGCAIDLDPGALPVRHAVWTRLARLRVLLIREDIDHFVLQLDAPCAQYAWEWLITNATLVDGLSASTVRQETHRTSV